MKRFICALLLCCFLPALALAINIDEFNLFASVYGASELDLSKATVKKQYTVFNQDGCSVGFEEEGETISSIFIDGDGYSFIAYCCAALNIFDPDGVATINNGQLVTAYLLSKNADEYSYGQTTNGIYFFITYENGKYSFAGTR